MKAVTKVLAGGVAMAALASAAPAAAQYYPGYGYGSPYGGNVVGQVLQSVIGGGYGGYGVNSQAVINQCASAVQARLGTGVSVSYGYPTPYGNAVGGRVLGISRVEPRAGGGVTVRGVATSGRYAGYAYAAQAPVDLTWKCKSDFRGFITQIDILPAQRAYGYGGGAVPYASPYSNSPYDYSQYGYRRY